MKIKAICVKKGEEDFYIKYRLDGEYVAVTQPSTRQSAKSKKSPKLTQLYEKPLEITKEKKKDLLAMCKSGIIPREYHTFYQDLPCSAKQATAQVLDEEEEEGEEV